MTLGAVATGAHVVGVTADVLKAGVDLHDGDRVEAEKDLASVAVDIGLGHALPEVHSVAGILAEHKVSDAVDNKVDNTIH